MMIISFTETDERKVWILVIILLSISSKYAYVTLYYFFKN